MCLNVGVGQANVDTELCVDFRPTLAYIFKNCVFIGIGISLAKRPRKTDAATFAGCHYIRFRFPEFIFAVLASCPKPVRDPHHTIVNLAGALSVCCPNIHLRTVMHVGNSVVRLCENVFCGLHPFTRSLSRRISFSNRDFHWIHLNQSNGCLETSGLLTGCCQRRANRIPKHTPDQHGRDEYRNDSVIECIVSKLSITDPR